jgi:DNA-binding transcriptional ArsR family regulator
VTTTERDLVLALRSELAAIEPSRACDRHAEAVALSGIDGARDAPVARLLLRLAPEREAVRAAAGSGHEARPVVGFDWAAAPEHCRLAWLRGLFLAHGSLSLAAGRTHLEFVVAPSDAPVLAGRLADAELPASWRTRRGRGVVTWKHAERVGTFLRRIGAAAALLEVEARQVSRALRGDLNRVLNAESANLQRAVGAAGRHVAAIEELAATGQLEVQPFVVRSVAAARLETPEATLSELAERLGVHRSAVQRALDRIERVALVAVDRPPGRGQARGRRPRDPEGASPLA